MRHLVVASIIFVWLSMLLVAACTRDPASELTEHFRFVETKEIIGIWDVYGVSSVPMLDGVENNDILKVWMSLSGGHVLKAQIQAKNGKTGTYSTPKKVEGSYRLVDGVFSTIVDGKEVTRSALFFHDDFLVTITQQQDKDSRFYIYYQRRHDAAASSGADNPGR